MKRRRRRQITCAAVKVKTVCRLPKSGAPPDGWYHATIQIDYTTRHSSTSTGTGSTGSSSITSITSITSSTSSTSSTATSTIAYTETTAGIRVPASRLWRLNSRST